MDDFEKELRAGFLQEAEQLLLDAEKCFLDLEAQSSNPSSPELKTTLEKIFRLAHNLKGSAQAVGFETIGHFTHDLESLLVKLKEGQIATDSAIVSLLLQSNDHIAHMVKTLKVDMEARIDSSHLLAEIRAYIDGRAGKKPSEVKSEPKATASEETKHEHDSNLASVHPIGKQAKSDATTSLENPFATGPDTDGGSAGFKMNAEQTKREVQKVKIGAGAEEAIRIGLRKLDILINNIGELVILQAVMSEHKDQVASPLLQKTIGQLNKITKDIQGITMGLRMVPLRQTFQKLQRTLRDTSRSLGKEIELQTFGEDTEMDKTVVDHLGDPLVHLIRNAADHGVEGPDDRVKAGKPRTGVVKLRATHQGDRVIIEIIDDGRGMDPNVLRAKAVEKGILRPGQEISDRAAYDLIFHSGFSTKAQVTDISGRGVGMDVVKSNIEKLQGEIQISTELGQGTTFRITLPLTLAIIDAMTIKVGDERYIIPILQVHESVQPTQEDIHYFTNVGEVLNLRGEQLPLFPLSSLLHRKVKPKPSHECTAVVVRTGEKPFAVLVDEIVSQQQVVIKRLGLEIQHLRGYIGSSILGDGRAALIVDLAELAGTSLTQLSRKEVAA